MKCLCVVEARCLNQNCIDSLLCILSGQEKFSGSDGGGEQNKEDKRLHDLGRNEK